MTDTIHEAARDVPVVERTDVVVCGAGPAGLSAAIAAARAGARVRLIESNGCLGGIWTAGLLSWVIDWQNKQGIVREISAALAKRGARREKHFLYDPESMKTVVESMALEAGVSVRLHTRVVGASVEGRRLRAVITESKSGREAWGAHVFVDATGDGDVAALAGCGFDLGREENGETQPMSLICLVGGVTGEGLRPFLRSDEIAPGEAKRRLREEMERAGVSPSYSAPTLFQIFDDLYAIMSNHEYGVRGTNAQDVTDATLRARAEMRRQVDALRALGGRWAGLRLLATAEHIGVREGRRIHGLYRIALDDLTGGARHEDAATRCTFAVDVHSTNPSSGKGFDNQGIKVVPYDIPLRALIARDVDGLMMAGRCISGDFLAHSSYRVTGDASAMGEAAGVVAAACASRGRTPSEMSGLEARAALDAAGLSPAD